MSKLDVTTQDLFRRLGPTSRSRSVKADAVFRRLRLEQSDQIADALGRAPKIIKPAEIAESQVPNDGDANVDVE